MPWRSIGLWIGFQAVWFTCALGAARGISAPGIVGGMALTAVVVATSRHRGTDAAIAIVSAVTGLVVESVLQGAGFVTFAAPWPSPAFAPAWIVALWLAFGTTLPPLAAALGERPLVAALLGAIAGPLAYIAGERLGALQLPASPLLVMTVLAGAWAIALPLLLAIYGRLAARDG